MRGGASLPASQKTVTIFICGLGASIAIAAVSLLTTYADAPFLMAPFGASCFLAFAAPDNPLAQPRNIILGHLISSAVGLLILSIFGASWWAMAVAVGLAVMLMQITKTGHAPAGADPLVVILTQPDWWFLIFPVMAGASILALVAVIFNNLRRDVSYPNIGRPTKKEAQKASLDFCSQSAACD